MAGSEGMHSYQTALFAAPFGTPNPAGEDPELAGFTRVAEVISIGGLAMTSTVTKITHLASPGKAHEKIPGLLDAGQITFKLNYHSAAIDGKVALPALLSSFLPAAGQALNNTAANGWDRYQWVIQFPDGGQWYATAFIQGIPFESPEDDRITVDVTLEVSGRPVFSEPA